MNPNNNILSYFIKDIKDATELAFYKQINHNTIIKIFYKDTLIYMFNEYCYNYIINIIKSRDYKFISKSNISYDYINYPFKYLYYKNDAKIKDNTSPNSILFNFKYNKYLNKTYFYYTRNNKTLLILLIIYYKKYKYIINYNRCKYIINIDMYISINKFTSPQILIPNKYELDYYCKFFNI